jgi:glycosyltransferase involved in cell wall biosynthesis
MARGVQALGTPCRSGCSGHHHGARRHPVLTPLAATRHAVRVRARQFMTPTRVALLTVGDPGRVTGGYLFHRRLADRASEYGAEMRFVSIPDLPLPWATATGPAWLRARATRTTDVLVLDSIAASAAAPWLGRVRAPIVGMLHQPPGGIDAPHFQRRFRSPFDRHAYRACSVLMVASDWLAVELVSAGLSADRIRIVEPGKDLDVAASAETGEREIGDVDRAELRRGRMMAALCVANWLPRKGILELLDAVAGLPDDVVTLHLVGDTATRGRYASRVHERIDRTDLRQRVVVRGLIQPAEVHEMYRTVDAFVLPSFEEPFGTVWGEAMAAGLPVVGWQAGNLPFLADHGRDGVLVPVGDVAALGVAIEWLARDPAIRERLGRAAYLRAVARPTWDETAARFFAIIEEVLSEHRKHAPRSGPGPL